ncbi:SDR family NAD(P)-dependent oxidoreductase [Roseivirga sp.]|uniref:SDR family NAD(P)-dependent oxidoreductase n=1 Tax=Roseivirga sp. TaxID=1964215 RepID=UPI003B524683
MKQAFDLTGKTAVVTGGGSGIGKAISKVLARHGAIVNILDLNDATGLETVDEVAEEGGKAEFIPCNVASAESVKKAFEQVGPQLDILINNAGIAHVGNLEGTSEEDLDKIYEVNVKGVYLCLREGIPLMKEKGGSIINVASIASVVGIADRFAYSMSKGAVYTMTLSVAKDYLPYNIRCNCVAPARIHTPFVDGFIAKNYPGKEDEMFDKLSKTQPIGRMGKPVEVANQVLYLVSDEASFITGSCYPIDGGYITLNS